MKIILFLQIIWELKKKVVFMFLQYPNFLTCSTKTKFILAKIKVSHQNTYMFIWLYVKSLCNSRVGSMQPRCRWRPGPDQERLIHLLHLYIRVSGRPSQRLIRSGHMRGPFLPVELLSRVLCSLKPENSKNIMHDFWDAIISCLAYM